MEGGLTTIGGVEIRLTGGDGGIEGWVLRSAASTDFEGLSEMDGLPAEAAGRGEPGGPETADRGETGPSRARHPNGALAIDHLVVFTPDLKRTVAAMEGVGFDLRRVREATEPGPDVRQAFFRPHGVIVEVVENPRAPESEPARFWGLTVTVADLDGCARLLGDRLGEVQDAVQAGRRIATVRREAGLGVPVALISPHARGLTGGGSGAF